MRAHFLAGAGVFYLSTSVSPTLAQSAESALPDALVEIVVTAQKKSERAQDVPTALTVLSGDKLVSEGVASLSDFVKQVPSLNLVGGGSPGFGQPVLRGITSGGDRGSVVGLYLDDAPFTPSSPGVNTVGVSFDPDLADIDRIEILEGPQSTLYGANSVGGLIKFVTKQPDPNVAEATLRVDGDKVDGGGSGYGFRLSGNVPLISGTAAIRASVFYRDDPGYIDNRATDETDVNRSVVKGARAAVLVKFSENIDNVLSGLVQNIDTGAPNMVFLDPATLRPSLGGLSYASPIALPTEIKYREANDTLTMKWLWGSLTNTASYTNLAESSVTDFSFLGPLLGAPGGVGYVGHPNSRRYSDELRIASAPGSLEWLVGAFFTHEEDSNDIAIRGADPTGAPLPPTSIYYNIYTFASPTSYIERAGFGDLTYHFNDQVEATIGTRYSSNRQVVDINTTGLLGVNNLQSPASGSAETYLATVSYKPEFNTTLYLRAASGYRPGGTNSLNSLEVGAGVPQTYGADKLWNYEGGIKGSAWDQRIRYSADAFHMRWTDVQLQVLVQEFSAITNAASAKSDGAEASIQIVPVAGLNASVQATYLRTEITSEVPTAGFTKGDPLPNSPKLSAASLLDYRWPAYDGVTPHIGATYAYHGAQNTVVTNAMSFRLHSYETLDLRGGVDWSHYQFLARVDNVANKFGLTGAGFTDAQGSPLAGSVIKPRTYGLSIQAQF